MKWRCRLFGHRSSTGVLYRDSTSRCLRCGRWLPASTWGQR